MSGVLMLVVIFASSWIKVSLHAAFAAFAAALLWPLHYSYVVVASVGAAAVCWSRVMLGRHSIVEVLVGSLLGALFGACVWLAVRLHG
jgi:membrane-associated phospholipid phosphatase